MSLRDASGGAGASPGAGGAGGGTGALLILTNLFGRISTCSDIVHVNGGRFDKMLVAINSKIASTMNLRQLMPTSQFA